MLHPIVLFLNLKHSEKEMTDLLIRVLCVSNRDNCPKVWVCAERNVQQSVPTRREVVGLIDSAKVGETALFKNAQAGDALYATISSNCADAGNAPLVLITEKEISIYKKKTLHFKTSENSQGQWEVTT